MIFHIACTITKNYYPDPNEQVNIHIKLLIHMIQDNNRVIKTEKGYG